MMIYTITLVSAFLLEAPKQRVSIARRQYSRRDDTGLKYRAMRAIFIAILSAARVLLHAAATLFARCRLHTAAWPARPLHF